MNKLYYLANVRMPTEKAHGIQIMKMCEAFARAGVDLTLVVTDRPTPIQEDTFAYYGVTKKFPLLRVGVPDTVGSKFGFWFESLLFARRAARLVEQGAVVYGRDELVLWAVRKAPIVWESHTGAWNFFARTVARRARAVVVISQGLKDFYIAKGVPAEKILVAHDGVDLDAFAVPGEQYDARRRLGLPLDKKIALYIGRLDGWKGVETFFSAADLLPAGVLCAAIGGEEAQVANLQKKYPHVRLLGYRPYRELAQHQAAADVLVLPNTGQDEISSRFTSPLKLFTYMAAGKPMVVSNLPSIREVIDESCAYFAKPDDAKSFAAAIGAALADPEAAARASRARLKVAQYTWEARAKSITAFVNRL